MGIGTTTGALTNTYTYNGDGTLVSQTTNSTTTNYTQDLAAAQSQVLAATTGITTTDYLYGQDIAPLAALAGGIRTWYGIDGQGSVRQSLDDTGTVLGVQNYDPFGQIEAGSSLIGPFGYTGELQDASTGQEYLRARWYQPGSGTLLGVDSDLASTGQPYSYVYDDPINGSDPTGLCDWYKPWTCDLGDVTHSVAQLYYGVVTVSYAPGEEGTPEDIQHLRARVAQDPAHYGWALPYLYDAYQAYEGEALDTLGNPKASSQCKAWAVATLLPWDKVVKALGIGGKSLKAWLGFAKELGAEREALITELVQQGIKVSSEEVVGIVRNPEGKIMWLEEGLNKKGQTKGIDQILYGNGPKDPGHIGEFAQMGINGKQEVIDFIMDVAKHEEPVKIISRPPNGFDRVYNVEVQGHKRVFILGVGDNGFIVHAHFEGKV